MLTWHRNYGKRFWTQNYILTCMCARIAAINLFEVDLDKTWNYLWCCYVRAPMPSLPLFQRAVGQCPRNAPPFRCPCISSFTTSVEYVLLILLSTSASSIFLIWPGVVSSSTSGIDLLVLALPPLLTSCIPFGELASEGMLTNFNMASSFFFNSSSLNSSFLIFLKEHSTFFCSLHLQVELLHRQLKFYQLNIVSTANQSFNPYRALYSQIPNNFTEHQATSVYHRAPLWRMRLRPDHSSNSDSHT